MLIEIERKLSNEINYSSIVVLDSNQTYGLHHFSYFYQSNSKIKLSLHTNGGARTPEWWSELPIAMGKNHDVIFGIDGLEDTHSLYRVDTDFNKIIENATTFISNGGEAEWHMLVFKHNEHDWIINEDFSCVCKICGETRNSFWELTRGE